MIKLVPTAPVREYATSHVPEISLSVLLKSTSKRLIVFCSEDKIPRLKLMTQFSSASAGHNSPITPSWNENLKVNFKKFVRL